MSLTVSEPVSLCPWNSDDVELWSEKNSAQGVPMAEDIDGELGREEEGDAHIEVEEQLGERGALRWQYLPHVRGW